ncbi:MAG: amino acid permease [Bryobacteraceae bacterium]|nr:amino acid permease [Bryobacteraceae bacterium]MDW8378590.1 amino acid permease [Bryobacterales bacterium]
MAESGAKQIGQQGAPSLRRELGVWAAVSIVVGTVIGSGIFLVPKTMVANVGSPGMVFAVWIFGGLLSLAGALTYAELAAALPEAGGEYVYLRAAYGRFWAFIYGWTQMWVAKSGSIATLATAFFYYLANFYPQLEKTIAILPLPLGSGGAPLEIRSGQLLAMAIILLLAGVNYFGVRFGGDIQVAVTIIKVLSIGGVILLGFTAPQASPENLTTSAPSPVGGLAGFFAALVAALWAYDGWNNVAMVSSEIKEPQRNLPRALILGTLCVIAIYLLANAAYFLVLTSAEVAATDRVAAEMMRRVWGNFGAGLVSLAAMISIFAALNGSILTGARVPYAMARDGLFFPSLGRVHPRWFTPANSILALSAWAALLVLSGRYEQLFTYVIFASWILYGMATASVIVLRRKQPHLARPYRTLGYPVVPILFVLVAFALLGSTLQNSPRESLLGIGIILSGLPFYFYWSRKV